MSSGERKLLVKAPASVETQDSKHLRVWRAQTKPCSYSAPQVRQWFANRPATCFLCRGILKGSLKHLPGVFNAAGSIVPEPSIMPPPIPFMDVVTTGCVEAEYMATKRSRRGWNGGSDRQAVLAMTALMRQSAGAGCWRKAVERSFPSDAGGSCDGGRTAARDVACRQLWARIVCRASD